MSKFSERLRKLRVLSGESQEQVGEIMGKSRESITKYETGAARPDIDSVGKIARHYSVSLDYLLGASDSDFAIILTDPELEKYEEYLHDSRFIRYIDLAAKIMDNSIAPEDIGVFVDNLIKYKKMDTEKTPSR